MVKYLGIRVAGSVILALYTAISTTLDILQKASLNSQWLPVVTFTLFSAIMYWIVYDINRVNTELLNVRPSITVQSIREHDTFYLKVCNEGAEGTFKAQIGLSSEDTTVGYLSNYIGFGSMGMEKMQRYLKGNSI
jgi:hypothetical protein